MSLDCNWKTKSVTFLFYEQSYAHADVHHHLHCTMHSGQCLSVSSVYCGPRCSPDACLLAWHLEPVVMKMMSVQVCSESTGHAEAVQMMHDPQQVVYCKLVDLLYSRHNSSTSNRAGNDADTQYTSGRGIPHRKAEVGRVLCCRSFYCL